jgi:hypothetical protein
MSAPEPALFLPAPGLTITPTSWRGQWLLEACMKSQCSCYFLVVIVWELLGLALGAGAGSQSSYNALLEWQQGGGGNLSSLQSVVRAADASFRHSVQTLRSAPMTSLRLNRISP